MEKLKIYYKDNVFLKIIPESYQDVELSQYFSRYVENYRFMPKFKLGIWDGKVRFYDRKQKLLPIGLLPELKEFCKRNGYVLDFFDDRQNLGVLESELDLFIQQLSLTMVPRDYQVEAFKKLVRESVVLCN